MWQQEAFREVIDSESEEARIFMDNFFEIVDKDVQRKEYADTLIFCKGA